MVMSTNATLRYQVYVVYSVVNFVPTFSIVRIFMEFHSFVDPSVREYQDWY